MGPTTLYQHTAELLDVRYSHKDYAAESATFHRLVSAVCPAALSLLDVACGTGRHLEHLRRHYEVEGLDLNATLLDVARIRVPDVALHHGDMCTFDLQRTYDLVTCLFGSITLFSTPDRLRATLGQMTAHLAPDGVIFIEPFLAPEVYREGEVVHNFRQTPDGKLSWMYVMRREGRLATWDMHWLIGTTGAGVRHHREQEVYYLFTVREHIEAMQECGLHVFHHARGLHGYGALVGRHRPWTIEEQQQMALALS